MIQVGDRIAFGTREATIVSRVSSGRHTVWTLDDSTVIFDLEQKVQEGRVTVLPRESPFEDLPDDEDDTWED